MKVRPFFIGLTLGTLAMLVSHMIAIHGSDLQWQREAYEHYAGVYYLDTHDKKAKWAWIDDYVREHLHGTPTPEPRLEKL